MTFQEQIKRARQCSAPLIAMRSADAVSAVQTVTQAFNGKSNTIPFLQWDIMRGLQGLNDLGKAVAAEVLNGQDAAMVTARPTDFLGLAISLPADCIVFAHNVHLYWNDPAVIQAVLNLRDRYKDVGAMFVGLAISGAILPAELTEHVLVIDEPLPDVAELATVARDVFKSAEVTAEDSTIQNAVDAVKGLSAFAAEQSLSLSMSRDGLSLAEAWTRKRNLIQQTPGLEVYAGAETFDDIRGLAQFKRYVTAIFNGNDAPKCPVFMDEIEKAIAQDAGNSTKTELLGILLSWFQDRKADGVLMLGVPGSGKSQSVKAIGNTFQVPVVSCNIAGMQDQFVGNSVKNLKRALATIDAISSGRPIVFATCNRLDSLSPEMKRRFKLGTFFFDLPTAEEREAIWNLYLEKYQLTEVPVASDGWTGAEIETCCQLAWRLKIPITESARYIVPVSKSSADSIKSLRLSASGKFLSATDAGVYRFEETATAPAGRKFREAV